MFRIKLTARAKKELKLLKRTHQVAILAALEDIKDKPLVYGKPLQRQLKGKYSYKLSVYRIIYTIHKKDNLIYILTVGHRSKVYD